MNQHILEKDFNHLKGFIEACLGIVEPVDKKDKEHLTTDRQTLLEMAQRLSLLADKETANIQAPIFTPWPIQVLIDKPESQKLEIILERFRSLEHRRYQEYLRNKAEFDSLVSELKDELRNRNKIVADIYAEIEKRTRDQIQRKITKLPWKLLPASLEGAFSQIVNHYQGSERHLPQIRYEIDRLHKVYGLNADEIYIGAEEFEGYVVFYFSRSQTAVLECPLHGNAIYVFQRKWQALSQLSKAALLSQHNDSVKRIIHSGNWFSRLEWLINSREGRLKKTED